ncbi:MAG: aminotransferase class I/II-fold pyridoxal phosphate-dependent enzyme [Clostridiaceae bacterium]|nr:aminotransferase class I/II-fold pyridoxal phosphate-dependent enzyme [Clostridiaceae bacterium]
MNYEKMTETELRHELELLSAQFEQYRSQNLKLNMARGVPCPEQLDLSMGITHSVETREDCFTENGTDCRTYAANLFAGVPELRRLFAEVFDVPEDYIIIGGNSSLNMIYDTIARMMLFGLPGGDGPWFGKHIKFLCPAPGYDRHFKILDTFGIELVTVEMTPDGPDMDAVEELVKDPDVRGLICVPKFSNPTGVVFSSEVVHRLAKMETAAPDFRIIWDNAYAIHYVYEDVPLDDIFAVCREYGHEDRVLYFSSTSKVTFPGAGVAFMAMDPLNRDWMMPALQTQTIGPDKMNQLRHVRFFKTPDAMREHMSRHAAIMRTRFDAVKETFQTGLAPYGIGDWGDPKGGYFFSLNLPDGCAQKTYELCRELGVNLTPSGATYPHGNDPRDRNLRIAPTFPAVEELKAAMEVLCICARLVYVKKLLSE